MLAISPRFQAALNVSYKPHTRVRFFHPIDFEIYTLDIEPGATISSTSGSGARRTASLTLTPRPGTNLFEIVSRPGGVFWIENGIDFGGGNYEVVPVFFGEVSQSAGVDVFGGQITLTLVDFWQRLERTRFTTPQTVGFGYRPNVIKDLINSSLLTLGVDVDIQCALGEAISTDTTFDQSRTDMINTLATEGALDVYQQPTLTEEGNARFIIRDEPAVTPDTPVWTFATGAIGNIDTASRSVPFDRPYNQVVVRPQADTQTWAQQKATLADETNPQHPNYVGLTPFFFSSPTIGSADVAFNAGKVLLQRLLKVTETAEFTVSANPALEVGDTVAIVHPATLTDPGFQAAHLIDAFTLHLDTGQMDLTTKSTGDDTIEES